MRMYAYTDVNLRYLRMYCAIVLVNTRVTGSVTYSISHSRAPGNPGNQNSRSRIPGNEKTRPGMKTLFALPFLQSMISNQ